MNISKLIQNIYGNSKNTEELKSFRKKNNIRALILSDSNTYYKTKTTNHGKSLDIQINETEYRIKKLTYKYGQFVFHKSARETQWRKYCLVNK